MVISPLILIPLIPFLAFGLIAPFTRLWKERTALLSTIAMGVSTLLAISVFVRKVGGETLTWSQADWLDLGHTTLGMGLQADGLTSMMLLVVTIVSLCVHVYSVGYMDKGGKYFGHPEKNFPRYFGYLAVFTSAMLAMVLSDNLILVFAGWEVMGLASYLLIGFWFDKDSAANASKKAFLTTKVGDVSLLLGVLTLYGLTHSFEIAQIKAFAQTSDGNGILAVAGLLIFGGAMGKSAQFFLHVWLPDAMEGPTPASSLIHAATMVAAGVYLVARLHFLFEAPVPATVVTYIGAFTALFAASIAVAQWDIKRVLAFSTISQLGYMIAGLGAGSVAAGIFHLFTHAFFKALLFMAAGAIIHSVHTNDMREMGGLRKFMPATFLLFLVGTLALSGIPPFSGFFSKDEILLATWNAGQSMGMAPWVMLTLAAGLTAFYMFRVVYLTFFGAYRGKGHPKKTPSIMVGPMGLLGALCIIPALIGIPGLWAKTGNWAAHFIEPHAHHHGLNPLVASISILVAVGGILWAKRIFLPRTVSGNVTKGFFEERAPALWRALENRLYVDEALQWAFVRPASAVAEGVALFDRKVVDGIVNLVGKVGVGISEISAFFDRVVVDGLVNLSGWITKRLGEGVRRYQTGFATGYLFLILIMLGLVIATQRLWSPL
ncbi:NADH-quinone oxidoreductase subunit L [bacterium]|nr:NADH-quinone oxidoreductase subunit L [bacterium]